MSRVDAAELLSAFAAVMRRQRIAWYVFGAQAVVSYGAPRMTGDVDVTVRVDRTKVPTLLRALRAAGFFAALDARHLLAMHWGTFRLTDEAIGEPPERLRARWAARGLPPERLWILDVGEARPLTD